MTDWKKIVVLANSRKHSGRCLAGKEVSQSLDGTLNVGAWMRPISGRPGHELSELDRRLSDGQDPRLLDVVGFPTIKYCPTSFQTENWLISDDYFWIKYGHLNWDQALQLIDRPNELWVNGHSTYNGLNDKIPLDIVNQLNNSILLIHLNSVTITSFSPGADFGNPKRRVQACFQYHGVRYSLWVTDPLIERRYISRDVSVELGECLMAISVSEPHDTNGKSNCYKLVASIIERRPEGG